MSLAPHEFVPDRSRLYCTACQLMEGNAIHDAALRPTTPQGKVDLAFKNYQEFEVTYVEARKHLAELALAHLRAMALKDHESARFVAFTCENTYFGHGQSGPVVSAQLLYDADGKPLQIVQETRDPNEPWYESDGYFDDEGWLYVYFDLFERPEMDDSTVYALDLETGLYTDEPDPALQEPEDEDEE